MRSNTGVNDAGHSVPRGPRDAIRGGHLSVATPTGGRQSGRMRLQDLIKTRKRDLGLTYAQMVERTEQAGYPISRSMFHHYADKEWHNIPTTDALRGIAAALEVDVDEVLSAAAESTGIQTRELHLDRGTRALLALLEDRTPEQLAALEAVVRSVTKAMDIPPDTGAE